MGRLSVVYIAAAGDYVKVGMTTDVERRMKELYTGCPLEVKLIWTSREMLLNNTSHLELSLHDRLHKYRVKGEWFQCHFSVAVQAAKEMVHIIAVQRIPPPRKIA